MFTGSNKDCQVNQYYQADRPGGDEWRLARATQDEDEPALHVRKWLLQMVVIGLVLVAVLANVHEVFAQGPQPRRVDAGGLPELFPETMLAYRLGSYYLATGDYERAVEQLSEGVAGIPEEAMAVMPGFQDMYWMLGEAQEAMGLAEEALASYQQWLVLAGDDAAPWTWEKVQRLEAEVDALTRVLVRGPR